MKKLLSLLAIPVLGVTLSFAQSDQKATSTDTKKPSAADKAAADPAAADTAAAQDDTAPRRADTRRNDRPDYGWIGLLGLAGLAGLMRRDRARTDIDRHRDNVVTYSPTRDRDDMRRAG
jgi:hypothetical protein